MKIKILFFYVFIAIIAQSMVIAQTNTNFEMIDSLVGLSANKMVDELDKNENYSLKFDGAESYSVLRSRVISSLQKNDISINEEATGIKVINYYLKEANVKYSEVFKDGLFGDYLVKRTSSIIGNYSITGDSRQNAMEEFNYISEDSVLYSELSRLENIAYPFAASKVPEEPFFSSALEPAIAIGTAAVAIYLFFNIRSK